MRVAPVDVPTPESAEASAIAWAEADPALRALVRSESSTAKALGRWGADLFRAGRAADAVTVFRATAALDPSNAAAWANLGIACDATGSLADAKACFSSAIAIAEGDADIWFLLGCVREKEGDLAGAESDLREAVKRDPQSAPAWKQLAAIYQRRGNPNGAITALVESLTQNPHDAAASANLGKLLYEAGRIDEAHAAYARAVAGEPENEHFARMLRRSALACDLIAEVPIADALAKIEAEERLSAGEPLALFEMTSATLTRFGHHDAALRFAKWRADRFPNSPQAHYQLAALVGADLRRSPDAYIVASFDAFAESFDEQLVDVLGYDVPQQLHALITDVLEPGRTYDTLDAGCGTGLCGGFLRPLAKTLTGLDLSPKMLDFARARGVYDALVCEELTAFLESRTSAYDLIVAADVLIYFGDLEPIMAAAAKALRPGGILAVSTEYGADDYRLGRSGRFAHSPAYVTRVAKGSFDVLVTTSTTLRREGADRVQGAIFVLRKH